jgi:hypothetical protein
VIKFNYKVIVPKFVKNSTINNTGRILKDYLPMLTDMINPEIIELNLDD